MKPSTAFPVLRLGTETHIERMEEADIQIERSHRVIEELLARQRRVLVVAEMAQGVFEEMREGAFGVCPCDGKPERFEIRIRAAI